MLRQKVARAITRVIGFKMVGEVPPNGILVGAPHTSNWDFITMLLVMWHGGEHPRVLVKKQLFFFPLGPILRLFGGIPIDRDNASTIVADLVKEAKDGESFRLVFAAEGTRSKGEYWKSGFYRLSQQTGLPITLAFFEPPTRTMGFGPSFVASGDVKKDMDLVREFYADKGGIRPKNATVPRLREEDRA